MKLLHIDASILGDDSISRGLSAAVTARFREVYPDVEVVRRDLAAEPIPHLTVRHLGLRETMAEDGGLAFERAAEDLVMEEFLSADVVVLGTGFYNWSIPSQLKAWIDRIAIVGRTFRYGDGGVIGLAGPKRIILTIARGGVYAGTPMQSAEHAESYLRTLFGMMGIAELEVISADGIAIGPDQRAAAIVNARGQIANMRIDR